MKITGIIILVLVIIAGVVWLYGDRSSESTEQMPPALNLSPAPTPSGGGEVVVEMTADGFSPVTLNIQVGTSLKFINRDTISRWPASGMHPSHQICPGFDSLRGIAPGESYSFKFDTAKTCPMHDHLKPSLRGAITVQ